MDTQSATDYLRRTRMALKAADDLIREHRGYVAQIARLTYDYAEGNFEETGSETGRSAETEILKATERAIGALEQTMKEMRTAGNIVARAKIAAEESNAKRKTRARKLGV